MIITKKSLVIIILIQLLLQTASLYASWGKGNLTVSESSFYIDRIERVLNNWTHRSFMMVKDKEARIIDTNRNLLVIDLDKKALWIEDYGKIQKEYYIEFPSGLKWKLYHASPDKDTELKGKTYLRIKGIDMGKLNLEMFCLVGQSRNKGYILFQFGYNSCDGDLRKGQYTFQPYKFGSVINSEKLYSSLIVTDKEYQQYFKSAESADKLQSDTESLKLQGESKLKKNKAAWNRIEKEIYLQIEKQTINAGLSLDKLTVKPGPDFSAGYAEVSAGIDGIIRKKLLGSISAQAYLEIDYLGNDIWYAKSASDPDNHIILTPHDKILDLEFIISSKDNLTSKQQKDLIEKGSNLRQSYIIAESKWKAVCSNGTSFELIGICDKSGIDQKWWGPDGSVLENVPFINTVSLRRIPVNSKIYEIVWRKLNMPATVVTGVSVEHSSMSYPLEALNRFGRREGMDAKAYVFDKTLEKTTLTFKMKDGSGNIYTIIAKNISLLPGQNPGFSIEAEELK